MCAEPTKVVWWSLVYDMECGSADLSDVADNYAEMLTPLEIEGVAVVQRKWAVRHPIDEDGDSEVQFFDSEADARSFANDFLARLP